MAQNFPSPYQHHIWRDYSQPPYQNLTLTLTSYEALLLLAFLSAFIAYAQTRWWIITRHVLILILRPVQLPDSDAATSLHKLSQAKAIKLLISKEKRRGYDYMTSISPWFGAVSLFNVLLFIALGTIVPFCLTGGSGPVKVRLQATDVCDGWKGYTDNAWQLAVTFYTQCRLNTSIDAATCAYKTRMVASRPQLNFSLSSQCPFEEGNCQINTALRIEYPSMQPWEYGLNADSRIRQSHSLTCAPLKVGEFEVPQSTQKYNATVVWVGYTPGDYNTSDTYASTGETIEYWPQYHRGVRALDYALVYDLIVYSLLIDDKRGSIYENFHPGLKSDEGDVFLAMLKFGVGRDTLSYSPRGELEVYIASKFYGPGFSSFIHARTYALGCFEQYQLCFDERCTRWSNAIDATSQMFQLLQSNYDNDVTSEVLEVQNLLIDIFTVRNIMHYRFNSPIMLRSIWKDLDDLYYEYTINEWHWEVQLWFEMAFLTAKFSLLDRGQAPHKYCSWCNQFSSSTDTDWICDKLLFLDDDSTNVNFIGLMATLSGLLGLCLISAIGRIFVWIKHDFRICWNICQWVGPTLQKLWRDLVHDLALAYKWTQVALKFIAKEPKAAFQATCRAVGLFAKFGLVTIRRSLAYQSRDRDYQRENTELG